VTELNEVLDRLIVIDSAITLLAEKSNPDDPTAARAMLDLLHQSEALLLAADLIVAGGPDRDFFAPLLAKTFQATATVKGRLDRIQAQALLDEAAASTIH